MKIVLAPDSFKESMSANEAVAAMRAGVQAAIPDAECIEVPMADGGEGTVDAVVATFITTIATAIAIATADTTMTTTIFR